MNTTTTTKTVKNTILRHVLTSMGENMVMLHPTAEVVAIQPHKKGVEVYVRVNGIETSPSNFPTDDLEPRRFYVAKTGETVAEASEYVGSAMLPTFPARHVFELA